MFARTGVDPEEEPAHIQRPFIGEVSRTNRQMYQTMMTEGVVVILAIFPGSVRDVLWSLTVVRV